MTDIRARHETTSFTTSNKKEFESEVDESVYRKLCVKNIATDTTEQELLEVLTKFGSVENIKLRVNTNIGPYAKYAVVLFSTHKEAKNCCERVNGYSLNGRPLRIDLQKYTGQLEEDGESYHVAFPNKLKFGNNKYYRKTIRTNHLNYVYTRYPNNKRMMKNDDCMNNEHGKNDTGTVYYQSHEPVKRARYNNLGMITAPFKDRREGGTFLSKYNNKIRKIYPNFSLKDFLMEYGGEQLVNSLNSDDVNSEVIVLVKQLVKELLRKPKRVKLMLCEHLKECTKHVFVRPSVDVPVSTTITFGTDEDIDEDDIDLDMHAGRPYASNTQSRDVEIKGASVFTNQQRDIPDVYANMQFNSKHMMEETNRTRAYNTDVGKNNSTLGNEEFHLKKTSINSESLSMNRENKTYTWSGVLEMRNKGKMQLIGYPLQNDEGNFLNTTITNIYISHRKKLKCLPPIETVYYFELLHEKDQEIFNSYKNYFNSKERVGLAATDQGWYIYIIFPGSPVFEQFYPYKTNNGIVGLICYDPHTVDTTTSMPADEPIVKEYAGNDNNKENFDIPFVNSQKRACDPNTDDVQDKLCMQKMNQVNDHVEDTPENPIVKSEEPIDSKDESNTNCTTATHTQGITSYDMNIDRNANNNSEFEVKGKVFSAENPNGSTNSVEGETPQKKGENNSEEEIPNWLNQFSSLAAYLVKR